MEPMITIRPGFTSLLLAMSDLPSNDRNFTREDVVEITGLSTNTIRSYIHTMLNMGIIRRPRNNVYEITSLGMEMSDYIKKNYECDVIRSRDSLRVPFNVLGSVLDIGPLLVLFTSYVLYGAGEVTSKRLTDSLSYRMGSIWTYLSTLSSLGLMERNNYGRYTVTGVGMKAVENVIKRYNIDVNGAFTDSYLNDYYMREILGRTVFLLNDDETDEVDELRETSTKEKDTAVVTHAPEPRVVAVKSMSKHLSTPLKLSEGNKGFPKVMIKITKGGGNSGDDIPEVLVDMLNACNSMGYIPDNVFISSDLIGDYDMGDNLVSVTPLGMMTDDEAWVVTHITSS